MGIHWHCIPQKNWVLPLQCIVPAGDVVDAGTGAIWQCCQPKLAVLLLIWQVPQLHAAFLWSLSALELQQCNQQARCCQHGTWPEVTSVRSGGAALWATLSVAAAVTTRQSLDNFMLLVEGYMARVSDPTSQVATTGTVCMCISVITALRLRRSHSGP